MSAVPRTMSFPVPLANFLKLDRCFANDALIMRQTAAPAILNRHRPTFDPTHDRFFVRMPVPHELFVTVELDNFQGHRPAPLEYPSAVCQETIEIDPS